MTGTLLVWKAEYLRLTVPAARIEFEPTPEALARIVAIGQHGDHGCIDPDMDRSELRLDAMGRRAHGAMIGDVGGTGERAVARLDFERRRLVASGESGMALAGVGPTDDKRPRGEESTA